MRGYCGIGIYQPKFSENIGTLLRSAKILGADFFFDKSQDFEKVSKVLEDLNRAATDCVTGEQIQ